jgi:hypothetical protein
MPIDDEVPDCQASATEWAKATPLGPIFEAQFDFSRKFVKRSAEVLKRPHASGLDLGELEVGRGELAVGARVDRVAPGSRRSSMRANQAPPGMYYSNIWSYLLCDRFHRLELCAAASGRETGP